MGFWIAWLLGLAAAGGVGFWLHRAVLEPSRQLRLALRRMADGDWDAPFQVVRPGRLGASAGDLRRLAGRLEEMDSQLRDETLNLQAILGGLSEGVLIIDAGQRIRLANASLHRMFDLAAPPLGRTLLEVFRSHTLHETVLAVLREGTPQSIQVTLDAQQAGRYVQKHFSLTAVGLAAAPGRGGTANARPVGAIAIFHDITELKTLSTMRRDFVANVSHELRTPLAIISGYLEELLDGALEDRPTAERFLQVMWKHTQRLNLLIEDLLSLSLMETRQAAGLTFESVQLRSCLDRVIERLELLIGDKGAAVTLELPEGLPPVEADAHRLDQTFFNLLENALKYGEAARPEIRVSAQLDGGMVVIAVRDNGPGIPFADQPHIFERFYRVHKNRARAAGGTGLGLSIVKHIVSAHGGQVAVESQPGNGTTFRLRLPVAQRN